MGRETASAGARVCVFTTAHDATDSRVVQREIESLSEAGYDVTYYTPFDGEGPVDVLSYGSAEPGTIPGLRERFEWATTIARILCRTDYDVYHFHDVEALPVGVLLGLLTDGSIVYDVHENNGDVLRQKPLFPKPVRPIVARAVSAVEHALARFVDDVVVASPDIAAQFADDVDATVVTNYPKRRWAEETEPADIAATNDDPIRFVYRGLLSEDRGIPTLVDAIDRVPDEHDVSLAIGGKYASEDDRERIERRMARSDRVEFVEWLPGLEDVIQHFRDADVGVMCFQPAPNKVDAAHRSNKLFQYMATGLPIVVSDVGNWSELVDDVGCGVAVDPTSPDDIAAAMTALAEDPERRETLGRNGHEAALDRYHWEAQEEKLLDVYGRLLQPKSGRQRSAEDVIETIERPAN